MIDPRAFIAGTIGAHEGELSVRPEDNGNWYDAHRYQLVLPQHRGLGVLVGSQFGVTAYALVRYRVAKGMPLARALVVTRADITAITRELAIDIGFVLFFQQPGFDRLVWNRVTMSILDKAWGSGPGTAIMMLQGVLGLKQDAQLGPVTATAYAAWIHAKGEVACARAWCAAREAKDFAIAHNEGARDSDLIFLAGWNARSESFLPSTSWWAHAA